MINVSELIEDPDFAFPYTVIRRTGKWVNARFVINEPPDRLTYYGVVQPATTFELQQLGIGDNEQGVMKFFCKQPKDFYIATDSSNVSDEIEFRDKLYKILKVSPWQHGNWTRAFGVLKGTI